MARPGEGGRAWGLDDSGKGAGGVRVGLREEGRAASLQSSFPHLSGPSLVLLRLRVHLSQPWELDKNADSDSAGVRGSERLPL